MVRRAWSSLEHPTVAVGAQHIPTLRRKQHALLSKISAACGTDLTEVKKPLTWAIKNVADAFSFARNEGLDFDINATLSHETIQKFIDLSHQLVTEELFGRDEQVRGDVLDGEDARGVAQTGTQAIHSGFYRINTAEEYWDRLKIGVFLNHRELMMALAKMLQIDDVVKQDLPAGSMFIFEVYTDEDSDESSMKMKFWRPTQPSPQEKYRGGYVDGDLLDHYGLGSTTEIRPKICEGKTECLWSDYRQALQRWTRRTGTWEQICHAKATPFGPPEDSLVNDDDEDDVFMSPHDHALHSILFGSSTPRSSAVQDSHHPAAAAAVADFGEATGRHRPIPLTHYRTADTGSSLNSLSSVLMVSQPGDDSLKELREALETALESRGTMGKVRAQLRAEIFNTLNDTEGRDNIPAPPRENVIINELIREYFEFNGYHHSLSTFTAGKSRDVLQQEIGVHPTLAEGPMPLMYKLVPCRRVKGDEGSSPLTEGRPYRRREGLRRLEIIECL
ncbi:hypothetical protein FOZ63_012901 [Perkinsus olseni]|uniref:LisH domain-containing protein n=1 Tax=Perkinsus olseni TaxID=32597 RepID=A0A7J6T0A4_PEROL|nr:hypothetical protein FOZ63_012901 [Perkinsus olseni]